MEKFEEWKERHEGELTEIRALLDTPLPDDPEALWQALRDIEAHYGRLQYLVAVADKYLDEAECQALECLRRLQYLVAVADKYLDEAECQALECLQRQYEKLAAYEKEKMVNAAVSDVRAFRDLIEGLIEAVKQRVMLGQSRMAYMRDLYIKGGA